MDIIRLLLLGLFLFLIPMLLGLPWIKYLPTKNQYRSYACFPIGVFVELAIFELLTVPVAFFHLPFRALCWAFGIVVTGSCFFSIRIVWKHPFHRIQLPRLSRWEAFYLIVFLSLLGWQLYNGFVRDTTYWSYDDAYYVTVAADTIRADTIQAIDAYTGVATTFNAHRAMQGWLYFPAFLSLISSISVATMERTVLETYDILLAYVVYAYMARVVFRKNVENGLIFLILLSVLHIWGWYSPYSVTFRLLGPNYQGKAILAVSFFPFLFTFLAQVLERPYRWKCGLLLMLLSAAASSFTLFGAVTMIINTTLVVGMSVFRKTRRRKHLLYIAWSSILPGLYCAIFFVYKYSQF